MKRKLLWCILLCAPLLVIFGVNEFAASEPTHRYLPTQCTRYCHDNGCPHAARKYEHSKSSMVGWARKIYTGNMRLLRGNSLGMHYSHINILIYVILFPLLFAILLWGAIKKSKS